MPRRGRTSRNKQRLTTRNGKPTHSRFAGVTWERRKQPWTAAITTGGKRKHLGHFDTEIEAAQAYRGSLPSNPL
jgi:hypothetical protein